MTQIELNDKTDRDLLVQTVTILNALKEQVDVMASQGMPRCEMHTQKMNGLSHRVGRFTKAAYACGLIVIAELVARVAWR